MTNYKKKIGKIISDTRKAQKLTQSELARRVGTSQSAINQIENGARNISIEMLDQISEALGQDILQINNTGKINFKVVGPTKLSGAVTVNTSKNAAVGLLCASLLNKGKTTLRNVARIEEVYRIIEVLTSLGSHVKWVNKNDLEIQHPKRLRLEDIDVYAAQRTRSILMFLGPLLAQYEKFELPFSGGCSLGLRTIEPHLNALKYFGLEIETTEHRHCALVRKARSGRAIVLSERGDTATENVVMAAALFPFQTIVRNASPNYMVQDVCFFLQKLGVKIRGIGTTTLKIEGLPEINKNVEYHISEDPIEAMTFVAAALVTNSILTINRVPIEFMELELQKLEEMGLEYEMSDEYLSRNEKTRLVDITVLKSRLHAPKDKLHAMPFPGINMDNLPFLGLVATMAKGRTLVHDWSYENRAIYFTDLMPLGAHVELVDPHRVYIFGPTDWQSADIVAPPALRPSVVILIAMMAASGKSILRDVYNIKRGYADFAERLNALGARIETIRS
ncbi:MAG: UDP-N-acetylglucosamine 1-carboxyvinyltransferase [Candidatus Nomurabacteria bacterium]|jgi:UDP-N-acetylglucosamine 1-carboxyvinyltransferase|nr:UDP-N-acetylglucosamine 1-carboxyvinyltransferase [Candidatus Nomurabacteria bacterium]